MLDQLNIANRKIEDSDVIFYVNYIISKSLRDYN